MKNEQHYENSDDFFELFEEDTFDKEKKSKGVWKGFVENDDGELVVAAEFVYDANKVSGTGRWDDTLI